MRLFILLAVTLLAAFPASAADPARGQTLAQQRQCLTCHGLRGVSSLARTPSLAAMPAPVTIAQLTLMREGQRPVPVMAASTRGLTDEQIADLGAFFESLPPPVPRGTPDPARVAAGQALAEQMRCASCHLPDFRGQGQMPRLAGQREDYLLQAMTQYRDNRRIGIDTQMTGLLQGVSDADLGVLAHFMSQQP